VSGVGSGICILDGVHMPQEKMGVFFGGGEEGVDVGLLVWNLPLRRQQCEKI